MLPLRRLLLLEFLGLYGVMLALLIPLAWWGGGRIVRAQVNVRMRETLGSLQLELEEPLREAERLGRFVTRIWEEGHLDAARGEAALALLRPLLEASEAPSALVLVDPQGRGLILSRVAGQAEASLLDRAPAGPRQFYLLRGGRPVPGATWAPLPWDPAQRPWYVAGAAARSPVWVEPYRFIMSQWAGISLALPARREDGSLLGVLCVDVPMTALATWVRRSAPTPSSRVLVTTRAQDRLILLGGRDPAEPEAFLRPVGPDFQPAFARLLDETRRTPRAFRPIRVEDGERPHLGWTLPLQGGPGLPWELSLLIPEQEVLGRARHQAAVLAAIAGFLVLLSIWRIHHLAGRFGTHLGQLAAAARALGEGRPPEVGPSPVEEIGTVAQALARAGQTLKANEHLQRSLEHAQRLDTVGTLAGGIAHDVNNQMAVILGQLNLGRQALEEDHPAARRIQLAEEAAQRCSRMVSTLLGFTHHARPELEPLDINALVRETVSLLERILGGLIRVDLDLEDGLPAILGDPVQLEQMLTNLAVNARDAMPEGGYLRFRTRLEAPDGIELAVEDTGSGIPPEVLPRIFEPFYTTKDLGKGTGLGLAMVFGIVQAHGGHIAADSEPGRGTRFLVRLPVAPRPEAAPPCPGQEPISPRNLAGLRILVADDEAALRDVIADALTEERAQVELATDGAQAWRLWESGARYDLVISDQRMPELTGTELLSRVRATGSRVPFILCSGYGLEAVRTLLEADPLVRTLAKPFTLKELLARIEELRLP